MSENKDTLTLDDVKHLIPESGQVIINLIGIEAAKKIFITFGGTTLPIPKGRNKRGIPRFNLICDAIGRDKALMMAEHFDGEEIYIPLCSKAFSAIKHHSIITDYNSLMRSGMSGSMAAITICPKYNISHKQVSKIISGKLNAH
ncbi:MULTISPECIES: Mor transcription activator family protein [Serratia]|uniref:Mor transcription activator family protein n=1 Tax=Serratia TaxID=613 RepID=UPI00065FC88C|nr:Mor transcription activator family protein [Serratia sp. 506_PEND]